MSISSIEHTMIRIEFAETDSPIAVFKCNVPGHVNALFAATIRTQDRINLAGSNLIGVFDMSMNQRHIKKMLIDAIHSSTP